MGAPVLFRHDASLLHETGHHPESALRIDALNGLLESHDWLGFERVEAPIASLGAITSVHDPEVVAAVERLVAGGGGDIDADTIVSPGSLEAALRASGGAVAMVDALLSGAAPYGFSMQRPPGHHAERARSMGFCLFNHIAVAAQHAIGSGRAKRVAIVDFDVHHGNGTQEIFWEREDVHFFSVHQSPLYPGSGAAAETGAGAGVGWTVNVPVPSGSGDREFLEAVGRWGTDVARVQPDLILVSAGFDAHVDDPLASCRVTDEGFGAIGSAIGEIADDLQTPVGVVLEGGYDVDALARSFVAFAGALTASYSS